VAFDVEHTEGAARAAVMTTPRGPVCTPAFMPVGTRGAVRALDSRDLAALGAQVVLANTYHLMLRPGAEDVARFGGLHRFMGWDGHLLTDSGGYQVFSLAPDVDDDGVTFASTYDGDRHRLTPERAVHLQHLLGADVQMVLDVCPPIPAPIGVVRTAVERTAAWAARAKAAHAPLRHAGSGQALFGIVQGGVDPSLRRQSAQRTVEIGFDGYAVGGLSVGEPRPELLEALGVALADLPADRPRYLMGVGDPRGLIEAIGLGVDLFDCVLPTRFARHGTILTHGGRYNLRAKVNDVDEPLDVACTCEVCVRWSRGYLRHLLRVHEPTALRLLTLHNVGWLIGLADRARRAIVAGTFDVLRTEVGEVWP
jgi:queuine tRNA-ribosyltransferase